VENAKTQQHMEEQLMRSGTQSAPVSNSKPWAGIIISALPALFLLFDVILKLVKPPDVVGATVQLGYPESVILPLGVVLLVCTVIYVIPRTAVLGAILLTGYLGGAVATHVRVENPLPTHTLFPVYIGALLWGGLFLRDQRMREYMRSGAKRASASKMSLWAGIIISALPAIGLLLSSYGKLAKPEPVLTEFSRLGYPESAIFVIGIIELACTVVYLIPRVSVLGAILLTGYLGGVVATHARIGDPFPYIFIIPTIFGAFIWGGLYLRDERLRALLPLRKET
jgi:DoxX-like protein